jgi:hypothetical protein
MIVPSAPEQAWRQNFGGIGGFTARVEARILTLDQASAAVGFGGSGP